MTDEQILQLLQDAGDFISGERISESLHISRTAVWKAINKLKSRGYLIESVSNRGYHLVASPDIVTPGELHPLCKTSQIGKIIHYFEECGSTNDEAKTGELRGDADGTVYITDCQTKGRGRMGRNWHNEGQKGIALSILLKPEVSLAVAMQVSLIAGLSVCKALESMSDLPFRLKWPNDIVINGRKIGGILIEMATSGEMLQYIVLGIGVNCNNPYFPDELAEKATSYLIETKSPCSRKQLICRILEYFEEDYTQWLHELADNSPVRSGEALPAWFDDYRSRCVTLGSHVLIHHRDRDLQGIAKDMTPAGELLVLLPDGKIETVLSGEVSVRGIYGYV